MNASTRQEAAFAIARVSKRLAVVADTDPSRKDSEQVSVIRKLRDSAQQAFDEQDYLTARSLAQKASVLADQIPSAASPQPSH
jgi:hypothetical protein